MDRVVHVSGNRLRRARRMFSDLFGRARRMVRNLFRRALRMLGNLFGRARRVLGNLLGRARRVFRDLGKFGPFEHTFRTDVPRFVLG